MCPIEAAIPIAAVVRVVSSPYDASSDSVLVYSAHTPNPAPTVAAHSTLSESGKARMRPSETISRPTVGMSRAAGERHAARGTVQMRPAVHVLQKRELR
eukprot:4607904-Prymnesium_polylepis.1